MAKAKNTILYEPGSEETEELVQGDFITAKINGDISFFRYALQRKVDGDSSYTFARIDDKSRLKVLTAWRDESGILDPETVQSHTFTREELPLPYEHTELLFERMWRKS